MAKEISTMNWTEIHQTTTILLLPTFPNLNLWRELSKNSPTMALVPNLKAVWIQTLLECALIGLLMISPASVPEV